MDEVTRQFQFFTNGAYRFVSIVEVATEAMSCITDREARKIPNYSLYTKRTTPY